MARENIGSLMEDKPQAKSNDLWWCILDPAEGKTLAPYMDVPRIFRCREHEAEKLFKKFYGIINTEHNFRVAPATEEQLLQQADRDEKRKGGVLFSREQILATMATTAA